MSNKHRVKGWWVICLMAGWGAQPLVAAEPAGAVSRAVEVAPPKGWTPDTPLFHDEGSASARDESPRAAQIPPARRSADAVAERAVARPVRAEKDASAKSAHRTSSRDVVADRPSNRERRLAASVSPVQKSAQKSAKARAGRPAERAVAEKASGGKARSGQKVAATKATGAQAKLSRGQAATSNTAKGRAQASQTKPKAQGVRHQAATSQDKKLARAGQSNRKGAAVHEEHHASTARVTTKRVGTRSQTKAQQASALKRSASGGKHVATAKRTPNKRSEQAVAEAHQRSPKQAQAGARSNRANAATVKKG